MFMIIYDLINNKGTLGWRKNMHPLCMFAVSDFVLYNSNEEKD